MKGLTYIPNPTFEADYLASEEALAFVGSLAAAAVPVSKALAPKPQEFLTDSIEADAGFEDDVATGRLLAKDFKAHWHENGTEHHKATPFLRPAVETITGSKVQ